jgi:hypothetical protein
MPAFIPISPSGGWLNPYISDDLDTFSGAGWPPALHAGTDMGVAARTAALPVAAFGPARVGISPHSYSDDYYHRVHVSPLTLDAGIVAADRVFSGFVWNALADNHIGVGA